MRVGHVVVDVLDAHAEPAAAGLAEVAELVDHPGRPPPTTWRSRCRSSRRWARGSRCSPRSPAVHVEERAAGVAAVDRGVGLDEVVVAALQRAVARRDDAGGDREALAERVADGEHPVADLARRRSRRTRRRGAARRSRP